MKHWFIKFDLSDFSFKETVGSCPNLSEFYTVSCMWVYFEKDSKLEKESFNFSIYPF
jgi:hypothetical protein